MIKNKASTYRDGFPGYMGHIPYKKEVVGMTVGATNDHIKNILTVEPNKEEILKPIRYDDFSIYNKDYFTENFCREYKLEEDKIFSNTSSKADTWINGSKYKIYPQHIPNYKAHVPGIYSSNIHGMGFSKSTAIAIKGDYCKQSDVPKEERYKSTFKSYFEKPKIRTEELENNLRIESKFVDPSSIKSNPTIIYKSKIANVPTPGYSGHTSIFIKPVSYLNKDKILQAEIDNKIIEEMELKKYDQLSESFRKIVKLDPDLTSELPFIVGYRGYRPTVRSQNYHGHNFRETSLTARRHNAFKNQS